MCAGSDVYELASEEIHSIGYIGMAVPHPKGVGRMPPLQNDDMTVKVLLVGGQGVGKTQLMLTSTMNSEFNDQSKATIGVSFASTKIAHPNGKGDMVKLELWDTAGQERYSAITKSYYRGASGAYVCFDLTRADTLARVSGIIESVRAHAREDVACVLVGCKSDLASERKVSRSEAEAIARQEHCAYMETSSVTKAGCAETLNVVLSMACAVETAYQDSEEARESLRRSVILDDVQGAVWMGNGSTCC